MLPSKQTRTKSDEDPSRGGQAGTTIEDKDSKIDEDRDEDRDDEWIPDEAHFSQVHEYAQGLIEKLH